MHIPITMPPMASPKATPLRVTARVTAAPVNDTVVSLIELAAPAPQRDLESGHAGMMCETRAVHRFAVVTS